MLASLIIVTCWLLKFSYTRYQKDDFDARIHRGEILEIVITGVNTS